MTTKIPPPLRIILIALAALIAIYTFMTLAAYGKLEAEYDPRTGRKRLRNVGLAVARPGGGGGGGVGDGSSDGYGRAGGLDLHDGRGLPVVAERAMLEEMAEQVDGNG
mmetsp:Transcript_25419/g.55533  ORF Transcript_25419/g.55533 Transcript_25419/m.55533 type:complete len:108 (-) Transcript_25419:267-590(-)